MESEAKRKKYTKIPNEILEALYKTNMPLECLRIVLFIARKTYGWNKTEDWISLNQFAEGTGILKANVCRAIKKLIDRNIIVKTGSAKAFFTKHGIKQQPIYTIQTDFKKWVGYNK